MLTLVLQWLVRLCAVILITLGALFWTGNAVQFLPLHMLTGIVLVLTLWSLALLAARNGAPPAIVGLALVWGFIVPALGLTQDSILIGDLHWLVKVLHLAVGLAAVGQAEALARLARSRREPAALSLAT